MKKLLIILSILIIGFSSHAQDVVGGRIIAKNSLFVRDRWVDTITVDTSKFLNYNRSIPTAGAVYSFVVERIAAGGGGGGGGTWGSITGTLSNQTDLQNALNLKAPLASPTFTGTVTIPSPFTLGATSVTSTGTQLNYLNAATGTTGTASTNIVYSTSPLFVTPRLASTSTIGYVWTATDASGNGSFQVIPSDNLIVQNAGSGTQTWFTSGDTLYMKKVKNTTFISASTDTDSSLLISLSATGTPSSTTALFGDNTWKTAMSNPMTTALDIIVAGASGTPTRLAAGSGGQFLRVNAGGTALEYATISGGGDVLKVGTPVNNQIGVWTGDGTIEGDANLTFASSTLSIGVAGSATGVLNVSGVTSGTITLQPASAAGTYTLTLPTDDGDSGEFLRTDGSGVLSWETPAGSGTINSGTQYRIAYYATTGTTLSEAAAITASRVLISDANGVPTHSTVTTTTLGFLDATSSIQTQIDGTVKTTGTQTVAGTKTFSGVVVLSGGFFSSTSITNSNFSVSSSQSSAETTQTEFLYAGATGVSLRVGMRGGSGAAVTAGRAYGSLTMGTQVVTEASSGTHPLMAAVVLKGISITNAAGATTDATTLYIDGPPVGTATITNRATSIWVASGASKFGDVINLQSYTVATLPAGVVGDMAYVTDATAPTYLGALTGGGAVVCPVFYNGSAWVSH